MRRAIVSVIVAGIVVSVGAPSADAGPCTIAIAQFEQAVRGSANNPNAGPLAPQSIGAQLGHQPTPGSVKRAQQRAQAAFKAALARAKRLDARGNAACAKALADAEQMYNLPGSAF
jgi:hypothetical protein